MSYIGANATFEHTSKFVLEGTDRLCIALANAGNVEPTDKIHTTASANDDLEIYKAILEIT